MDEELEKQLAEQAANTNVNDVNDTYSGSTTETSDDDLVIKNQYQDSTDSTKYSSTPNTTTSSSDSATGTGLSAATGTQYSWNTSAEERANLDYQASVLESRENLLSNRQEIETNAQTAQTQYAMQQYSQNQSSEKVGWTGGYILDAERQVDYLKQTIQAQMYGQMELQKYGYDTSLAAARLAYDTNKYDLALEYYNTALSRAVSEAEITGYYISPETSEMLNQYSIAASTLNSDTATEAEKQQADSILAAVYDWFEANGISKQGVETYSHIVEEREWKLGVEETLEYIDQVTKQIDSNTFSMVDSNGNTVFNDDGTSVKTVNFQTMSTAEILEYITDNETATQQFYGYLDTKITQQSQDQFYDWLISNNLLTAEEQDSGTTSYVAKDGVDYASKLYEFLKESAVYQSLIETFTDENLTEEQAAYMQSLYENWDFEVDLPDGSSLISSFNELQTEVLKAINAVSSGTLQELTQKDENGNYTVALNVDNQTITIEGNTSQAVYIADSDLIFWSVQANNDVYGAETDFTLTNGIGDKYNLELAESIPNNTLDATTEERIKEIYERVYGKPIQSRTVIFYNGQMYLYIENFNAEGDGTGFGRVKGQCGKSGATDLTAAIEEAVGKSS